MINENDFFRQATLKICGNLAIEQALHEALLYIGRYIPIDVFFLEYFDPESNSARTIARADGNGGVPLDLVTPIPADAREHRDFKATAVLGKAMILNHCEENHMATTMLRFHNYDEKSTSLITMQLIGEGEVFGGLVAIAEKRDAFTDEHAQLISSLSKPFSIAMANALHHRDVLLTKDRLVDENEFFRNMTMHICGNLVLEDGLHACMEYLTNHIPGYAIYLQQYDPGLGAMRLVSRATMNKGERLDRLVPMSDTAKAAMTRIWEGYLAGNMPPVFVVNDPKQQPVTMSMLEALDLPLSSALSLPLLVNDQPVGALVLLAEGENRFSEEHIRLYSTLKVPFFIAMSNTLKHMEVLKLKDMLADDNRFLQREIHRMTGDDIIGSDFGLKHVMDMVRQVAPLDSPVLLMGETGVGKDVIANAIHFSSPRNDKPFIAVNSGAIPDSLLDSELFGHEKGAFTGALKQKRGRFERADKGTIFLDEIGELPPQAQIRLLRVVQNREIERVGGTDTIPIDVRIIAATHRSLEDMVAAGQFREDLWFRLNVFPITIPPLRERTEDIPALVHHFIESKSNQLRLPPGMKCASGEMNRLMAYHWPGNVRELENVVERALILHPQGPLSFNLQTEQKRESEVPKKVSITTDAYSGLTKLDDVISHHIKHILGNTNGKVQGKDGAAALLGVNPSTLRNKMKKLGIPYGINQ